MDSLANFKSLGLASWIIKQMQKLGVKQPTPIQQNCIPKILEGKDCIGAAKTGSGKTFAFALPILQKLSEEPVSYFALVLTPTHELAYQIAEQFQIIGQPLGIRCCVVSGGTDQMIESQNLQNRPHIIVAMPGRLADHLTGCDTFSFDSLRFLVIDEADRMLNGDFDESLTIIRNCLPQTRQNLYFSATMKDFIKESSIFPIANDSTALFEWSEESNVATVETLDQRYILCADYDRDIILTEVVRKYREDNGDDDNIMIFTNTKKYCQLLSMTLNKIGFENVCLHGFMRQKERVAALNRFKSKHTRILIATDVAARGLDIPHVRLVINHQLPRSTKEYIHRVGRTARAGRNGLAITIFRFHRDLEFLAEIESTINTKLTEHPIDQRMIERIFMQVDVTRREFAIELENQDFDERARVYRRKKWILQGLDPDEMEAKFKQKQKDKIKERRRQRNQQKNDEKSQSTETHGNNDDENKKTEVKQSKISEDERFKNLNKNFFNKKLSKRKTSLTTGPAELFKKVKKDKNKSNLVLKK